MKHSLVSLIVLLIGSTAHAAGYQDFLPCEPFDSTTTLHDINDPGDQVVRGTVESNHFTSPVETLQKGQTAPLPRDIAFVLRAFPNHYRALNAMARWQLQNKLVIDPESQVWTADCYFQRALEFRPDDWKIHFIYGIYLHGAKRVEEANREYDTAEQQGADNAEFYYNRGLLDIDTGNLTRAAQYADKAYALGVPLSGLRDKLARAQKAAQSKKPVSSTAPPATKR